MSILNISFNNIALSNFMPFSMQMFWTPMFNFNWNNTFFPSFPSFFTPNFSNFDFNNVFSYTPPILRSSYNPNLVSIFFGTQPRLESNSNNMDSFTPIERKKKTSKTDEKTSKVTKTTSNNTSKVKEQKSTPSIAQNSNNTNYNNANSSIPYSSLINKYAKQYNVEPAIVCAIMRQESCFNPNATSHCGAQGLMQLMPATAKDLGVIDAYNPESNIEGGVRLFSRLLKRYNGNKRLALAAYNAGPGRVKNGKIPQIKETQDYVKKVMKYYEEYKTTFV